MRDEYGDGRGIWHDDEVRRRVVARRRAQAREHRTWVDHALEGAAIVVGSLCALWLAYAVGALLGWWH